MMLAFVNPYEVDPAMPWESVWFWVAVAAVVLAVAWMFSRRRHT